MTCNQIKDFIENKYNVSLLKKSRYLDDLIYKYAYYYLCQRYSCDGFTLNRIGKNIGQQYNAVENGIKRFRDLIETENRARLFYKDLETELLNNFEYEELTYKLEPVNFLTLRMKYYELVKSHKKQKKTISELRYKNRYK